MDITQFSFLIFAKARFFSIFYSYDFVISKRDMYCNSTNDIHFYILYYLIFFCWIRLKGFEGYGRVQYVFDSNNNNIKHVI